MTKQFFQKIPFHEDSDNQCYVAMMESLRDTAAAPGYDELVTTLIEIMDTTGAAFAQEYNIGGMPTYIHMASAIFVLMENFLDDAHETIAAQWDSKEDYEQAVDAVALVTDTLSHHLSLSKRQLH